MDWSTLLPTKFLCRRGPNPQGGGIRRWDLGELMRSFGGSPPHGILAMIKGTQRWSLCHGRTQEGIHLQANKRASPRGWLAGARLDLPASRTVRHLSRWSLQGCGVLVTAAWTKTRLRLDIRKCASTRMTDLSKCTQSVRSRQVFKSYFWLQILSIFISGGFTSPSNSWRNVYK